MNRIIRQIKFEELTLAKHLLTLANDASSKYKIPSLVKVLDDGEMGGIEFASAKERKYGKDIIQVRYIDADHVVVLITLEEDNNGDLYELEFWKTNFAKLIKYPKPEEVVIEIG